MEDFSIKSKKVAESGFFRFLKKIVEIILDYCGKSIENDFSAKLEVRFPKYKMVDSKWRTKKWKKRDYSR